MYQYQNRTQNKKTGLLVGFTAEKMSRLLLGLIVWMASVLTVVLTVVMTSVS
jgi:hypothetical protein